MEYVVLARKLRPMRFEHLIGQETVVRALRNAVQSGRTAHAYLFAGSRGVGKTSAARILAKAINCLNPAEGEPCNACGNCEEITHNASPDVVEIDAASNRGIDNIRELRENTRYAPAKCAFKTYIIDEVHMLTMESFNALLKTLEEPPPHIRFVLATTAPHRIPETVLSRCQRFDFPRIPLGLMVEYLGRVTKEEGIELSPAALETIARNAAGGMRDALTAVDQVVAFSGPSPTDEQVLGVLGSLDASEVLTLLGAVLGKSLDGALAAFAAIVERGHDLTALLEALLREVKDFSLYKTLGEKTLYFQDHPPSTLEFYGARKDDVSLDELQQVFYLLLELESQLRHSEYSWACFEMALIKACRVAPLVGVPELLAQARRLAGDRPAAPPQSSSPERRPPSASRPREREGGGTGAGGNAPTGQGSEQDGEAEGAAPPSAGETSAARAPLSVELEPRPAGENAAPPEATGAPSAVSPEAKPQPSGEPASATASASGPAAPAAAEIATAPAAPNSAEGLDTPADTVPPAAETVPPPDEPMDEAPVQAAPVDEAPLDEPLPCEDPRWVALLEAVKESRRKLAADLRRAEVVAITDEEVEVVPPEDGAGISETDVEFLREPLAGAFGAPFHLRLNRDSNRKVRHDRSMVGREEQRERARRAAEREAAAADGKVQRILGFFPDARIERIQSREDQPDRRDDV